jgi:hypothetical protein
MYLHNFDEHVWVQGFFIGKRWENNGNYERHRVKRTELLSLLIFNGDISLALLIIDYVSSSAYVS